MRARPFLVPAVIAAFAAAAALIASTAAERAHAQPSPMPTECVCSRGVNLGTDSAPVVIRHCQCGILNCAVVVSSGQLQCSK
ncbi:hypothetical protein [Thauera sinica]|uniref:Uncharacterized protein n=1 Tax=Thauera sinica TaxID=2665146 RepID=A0ABW1AN02_9RHOO|nr:hypothetical protein [Thauera sp. K11]